jgi:DNA replication and repair protein RecF
MGFARIGFLNFRNLADGEIGVGARQVLLVGENGQGKTNLLEAVYLLCVASSFREDRDAALLRDPALPASLAGRTERSGGPAGSLSIRWEPGRRREVRVNDKPVNDRRELLGEVLCICFVQQDADFVVGPPEARRRFFDQVLALAHPAWLEAFRDYRRVLRARNAALKAGQEDLLDVLDEQIAPLGLALRERRESLVADFNDVFTPLVGGIMGGGRGDSGAERVAIRYRPSWAGLETPEAVIGRLAADRAKDLAFGTTTSGPHRDRFSCLVGGRDFAHFASTGQVRLCALALRVAQSRFLAGQTGRRPVLLLDDVLLELDPGRKRAFVDRFPDYEQAFFTFLPEENHLSARSDDALLLTVANGEFRS